MNLSNLSKIDKRLISTAAAIAAGCKPCTAVTVSTARDVGASEQAIKRAAGIALEVKKRTCDEMQLEVSQHLQDLTDELCTNEACTVGLLDMGKTDWLIATGAAFAVNSTSGFERYSSAAEKLGATKSDLIMTVEIARHVKKQAGKQVDNLAAMLAPDNLNGQAEPNDCGCSADSSQIPATSCS